MSGVFQFAMQLRKDEARISPKNLTEYICMGGGEGGYTDTDAHWHLILFVDQQTRKGIIFSWFAH